MRTHWLGQLIGSFIVVILEASVDKSVMWCKDLNCACICFERQDAASFSSCLQDV